MRARARRLVIKIEHIMFYDTTETVKHNATGFGLKQKRKTIQRDDGSSSKSLRNYPMLAEIANRFPVGGERTRANTLFSSSPILIYAVWQFKTIFNM